MGRRLQKSNVRHCTETEGIISSAFEPELRAEELKFICFPEPKPKLWIAAPAPLYLPQTWKKFYIKNHGCYRKFCKLLQFQSCYLSYKKVVFFIKLNYQEMGLEPELVLELKYFRLHNTVLHTSNSMCKYRQMLWFNDTLGLILIPSYGV